MKFYVLFEDGFPLEVIKQKPVAIQELKDWQVNEACKYELFEFDTDIHGREVNAYE